MTPFDDISLIKEGRFRADKYYAFINLFQSQADTHKDNVYIRYQTTTADGIFTTRTLTYGQVDLISTNLACAFHEKLGQKSVISILEDHSVYYLIILYAFYKLRIPVQMISTRNSPAAICNLLKQADSDCLIYGESYQYIKDVVSEEDLGIECFSMPAINLEELSNCPLYPEFNQILDLNFYEEDLVKIVIMVHSSGTTAAPKVVRWSNQYLIYNIQAYAHTLFKRRQFEFIEDENDVLIAITPSFHTFGMYSNFHAILSGGSLYFFQKFPPTAKEVFNVMHQEHITRINAPPYFINQMMHYMQETGDIQTFRKLKLIVSGGAATPKLIDDFFLKHKINLVTVLSMSECFHLMSSEVSSKRVDSNTYFFLEDAEKHAYLEHFDGDRYQLIIRKGSPFLATGVDTRENGEYATKDLVKKSDLVENGYSYVGRADDTLVMVNGEKTNPLPMEDIIKSNPLISQCTVIGEGQPCTAVLIELNFEATKDYCLDIILKKVHESVKKANKDAPNHSAILPEMIKIIPFSKHLIASDKGTISRKRSIAYFQKEVDDMYTKFLTSGAKKQKRSIQIDSDSIESCIMRCLKRVLGQSGSLKPDLSLFKQGLNSLLSIQLQNYLSEDIAFVPQDFMYEHPTIISMINFFSQLRPSNKPEIIQPKMFNYQDTTNILNSYLQRASKDLVPAVVTDYTDPNDDKEHVVILTGATGSLGASILRKLLENPKIKKVYALVRDDLSTTNLMGRIVESFRKRGYPELELCNSDRVQALPMNLEQDYFGLPIDLYEKIRSETTMMVLCAWLLDFNQTVTHYDSECIKGLYNMIKFANREVNPIHLHYISSVSATGAYYGTFIPEAPMPNNPQVALPMGYGQSKFIVEQLLQYLVEKKNMPCYVHRVGQLCGDSITGAWNTTEMYPLTLIGGACHMKKMPDLSIIVNWLPVDFAGNAIVDIMMTTAIGFPESIDKTIFHIVNANEISWSCLLDSMKECGMIFDVIDPLSWVEEVSRDQSNPCYKLLGFYQKLFINGKRPSVKWETSNTCALAPTIKQAPNVSEKFSIYLEHWKLVGFYNQ